MKSRSVVAIIGFILLGLLLLPLVKRVEYRDFESKKTIIEQRTFYYGLQGNYATSPSYVKGNPYVFVLSIDGLTEAEANGLRMDAISLLFAPSGKLIRITKPVRTSPSHDSGSFSVGFVFPAADLPYEDCTVTVTVYERADDMIGRTFQATLRRRHRFETIFLPYEWMLSA